MQEWFDILKIEETRDKTKIEEAYLKCIQEDPKNKILYKNAKDFLLKRLNLMRYEDVLLLLQKEISNPDIASMCYRVKEVVKSRHFQMYKHEKDFQTCIAEFLKRSLTNKTLQLFLKEFPLNKLEKDSQLYLMLSQFKDKSYRVTLFDKIIVIIGLVCAFLHIQWGMMNVALFYIGAIFVYSLLVYIRIKRHGGNGIVIVQQLLLIIFIAVTSINYGDVGKKLGNQSFDAKVVNTSFVESDYDAKVVDHLMYIYDLSKASYQVYNTKLQHVNEIKMEYDFRSYYDDMICFGNQYYNTIKNDEHEFIIKRHVDNQEYEVYKEKVDDDYRYTSRFYKDGDDCYLVVISDQHFKIFLLEDNEYQILIDKDLEYDIHLKDMTLKNGHLFFMDDQRKNVYGYNLYTDEILSFIQTTNEHIRIEGFELDNFHIIVIGNDRTLYVFPIYDENEQEKYIQGVDGDCLTFFDSQRILFIDGQMLSMYDIENKEYENTIDLNIVDKPIEDCFLFGEYMIIYDGSRYNAIEIHLK